jgi:hypothetical protein
LRSAPEKPAALREIRSKASLLAPGVPSKAMLRIFFLASAAGGGTKIAL